MDGSIKNINDLIAALKELGKGQILANNNELYEECKDVFKRLGYLKIFDPNDVQELITALNNLPEELKTVKVGELNVEAEKLDSRALNKQDLDSLIKDYEEAQDKAVKEIYEREIYKRTGKENVDQFIKGQKEIAARNAENLKKIEKIDPKLKGEIETKLAQVEEGMEEIKAKKIEEIVLEEKEYTKKELEKEVQKIVKDKEKAREISQEIRQERAEIKVIKSADDIASKMCEELKNEQVIVTEKTRVELRENILKSWEDGEKLIIPQKITGATQSKSTLEKINIASENFKNENLETVVNYRIEKFKKEVSQELRKSGVRDENTIREFVEVAAELRYSTERIVPEINSREIADSIYASHQPNQHFEVQPENAVSEAREVTQYLVKSPRKFNNLVDRYNFLREKIGADKLPKIEKLRVTDKLMGLFKEGTEARKWINGAQRMVGVLDKVNNFPANLLAKFGFQDAGLKIIGRIGGGAAKDFMVNAAAVIAKEGTLQGLKSIFGAIFSGSVPVGGSAALTGALAAFQALPVVGQIIAVIAAAVMLLKPIFDGVKKLLRKLNIGTVGDFFENTLNLGKGGTLAVIGGIGAFFAGLPAMLSGIGPLVGIVFVGVILFITGCNMSNQQMVSTLVPPPENGNCVLKSATDGGNGDGNCNSSVGDKTAGGLNSTSYEEKVNKWDARGGTNLAKKCFNDTVCRSESAGVDPKIALTIWLSESSASNYTTPRTGMDFGISSAARKNFNAQITVFLKQPAAMLAECGNKNSGTATEKFIATFVRTETGVCPDPKTGEGKKYVDYIRMMYQFLFNKDLPNTPLMTASGDSCGTGNSDALSENTREVTDPEGNVWVCKENAGGSGGDQTASLVPATPIYDNSCLSSPAYCVVDYLINNGVLIVDRSNVEKVAKLIDQWQNAPSNFNKAAFNSAMIASATTVGPEYVFQCVGFAVAVNSELGNSAWGGSVSSWDGMIAHGSAGCPRIEPSGAGVGDFILFPSGSWYHVVVLSKLSSDGSFSISQANWGAPGKLSNVEGSNISAYLNGKSVLRCK